ncbi:uncharacterized protein [Physcomitrium patens]|uniref:uncharacterized protein n=1 Tax=Physcomitrium patens TaxID=3218 RepID=UPI003CCD2AF7
MMITAGRLYAYSYFRLLVARNELDCNQPSYILYLRCRVSDHALTDILQIISSLTVLSFFMCTPHFWRSKMFEPNSVTRASPYVDCNLVQIRRSILLFVQLISLLARHHCVGSVDAVRNDELSFGVNVTLLAFRCECS